MTWQWAGRRPGAGLPRLLPRAGRLLQRWCGPAETWRRCACRLCCGFPGATYLTAKIMQASGKRACSQFPECSLSSAKIQHFITLAKCLGVFRSATPKRPAPTVPSAMLGGKRTSPLRSPGQGRRRGARFVKFARCDTSGATACRPAHCETGRFAAPNRPFRPAKQAVRTAGTDRRTWQASRRGGAGSRLFRFFASPSATAGVPSRHFAPKHFAVTPVFLIFA